MPTEGEISPSRLSPERLLGQEKRTLEKGDEQVRTIFTLGFETNPQSSEEKLVAYREMTLRVALSQVTPLHIQ